MLSSLVPPLDSSKNSNGTGQGDEQEQSQFEDYVGKHEPIGGWKLVLCNAVLMDMGLWGGCGGDGWNRLRG
jgi:hypothetical protein